MEATYHIILEHFRKPLLKRCTNATFSILLDCPNAKACSRRKRQICKHQTVPGKPSRLKILDTDKSRLKSLFLVKSRREPLFSLTPALTKMHTTIQDIAGKSLNAGSLSWLSCYKLQFFQWSLHQVGNSTLVGWCWIFQLQHHIVIHNGIH